MVSTLVFCGSSSVSPFVSGTLVSGSVPRKQLEWYAWPSNKASGWRTVGTHSSSLGHLSLMAALMSSSSSSMFPTPRCWNAGILNGAPAATASLLRLVGAPAAPPEGPCGLPPGDPGAPLDRAAASTASPPESPPPCWLPPQADAVTHTTSAISSKDVRDLDISAPG